MSYTAEHRQAFLRDGYVVVDGLISSEDVRRISDHLEEMQRDVAAAETTGKASVDFLVEPGGGVQTRPAIRKFTNLARHDEILRRIASAPAITAVVADLTGGDQIMLYSDQAFLKPAQCGSAKPLHQDNSYFKIEPDTAGVTCWIAIDDATLENGCMRYIPGSHRLGRVRHKEIPNTPHLIPDTDRRLGAEVAVPIPAGSCIFHHLCSLHSSGANTSTKSRRAWTLHYASRAATNYGIQPWSEMLEVRSGTPA
jgi:ectoine hydroxylase-related dioxygenase (phytanoyl-CoA dioxygenase family)